MSQPDPSADAPRDDSSDDRVCVLLACFAGAKRAAKVRGRIGKSIREGGGTILDEAVLEVGAAGKAHVYDPRRTVMGAVTPALTWGAFGLLVGGLQGLWVWGLLGAICGGAYAYLTEHLLTRDELKQIGERLPADSSAIAVFVQGPDAQRMLSAVAPLQPVTASIVAIAPDLSAEVYADAEQPVQTFSTSGDVPSNQGTALSMLLVRFAGERGARQALDASATAKHPGPRIPQVELVVEADGGGRRRVINPTTGTAAMAKSDVIGWGVCGLLWGAIVGFVGGAGALGPFDNALVVGLAWAIFGLVAGALYGMWAGRAVSARRLKRIGPFVAPDTSLVLAWAGAAVTSDEIERWAASGSERLVLRFIPAGQGALLEV